MTRKHELAGRYNYVPYREPGLPPYGTSPEERAAYRKAVRAQQARDRQGRAA